MSLPSVPASLAAVLVLAACAPSGRAGADTAMADSASQAQAHAAYKAQLVDGWSQKFNAGDAAGLAALYAPDAVRYPSDAAPVRGRAAIQASFEQEFGSYGSYKETAQTDELHGSGDGLVEIGSWSLEGTAAEGGQAIGQSGEYMIFARRDADGNWKIHREMWTTH